MSKKILQKMLNKLEGTNERTNQAVRTFEDEVKNLRTKLQEEITVATLEEVNSKINKLRKSINLDPIVSSLETLKENLEQTVSLITKEIESNNKEVLESINNNIEEQTSEIKDLVVKIDTNVSKKDEEIKSLNKEVSKLQSNITNRETDLKLVKDNIKTVEEGLKKEISKVKFDPSDIKVDFENKISELNNRLSTVASRGGGSANQKISVNGTYATSRYADINLVLTGATVTNNDTTKTTDIDLDGSASTGFLKLDQSTPQTITGTTGPLINSGYDWSAGNVVYVPLTGDIATYVAAASAGDTLVLAAGNYAITAQINLTQAINIVGQGVGQTTITHTATEATDFTFYATASNVRIAHLTITMNHSVGTTRAGAIRFDGTAGAIITGGMVTNVNITNTTTTAQVEGITFTDASGTVRDCNVTATTSGTNKAANALYFLTNATAEAATTSYIYNTHATSTGTGTSISSVAFYTLDNGSGYDCNVYLYDCNGTGTGTSAMEAGIYANNDNAKMYAYNCIFKGDDYDAAQANSAVVQLSNCTLVNNTTNGTITYDGAIAGEGLTLLSGGDIRPSADSTTAINIAQADGTDFVTFDTTNKRVGIGTAAPASLLNVNGIGLFGATAVPSSASSNSRIIVARDGGNCGIDVVASGTAFPFIQFDRSTGTLASPTAVASGDELGAFLFGGHNGTSTVWTAAVECFVDGAVSGSSMPTRLVFSTGTVTPRTERMRIDSSGNVGIGTTAPTTTSGGLDISSGGIGLIVGADNVASTRTNSTTKYAKMGIPHYTNTEEPMNVFFAYSSSTENLITYGGGSSAFNAATKISFNTAANNTTTTGTERMVITSAGNVGIGTTAPTAVLHLKAGTATASTAPLKFTSGVSLTNAEAGAMEYTTDDLFFTIATGTARKRLLMADAVGGLTSGKIPVATTNGRLADVTAQTELTDEDATATDGTDATQDQLINNMRTRINELETKLTALGLLVDAD